MDKEAQCFSTHFIHGDGAFNGAGLDKFIKQVNMRKLELSYAVVAIMGPQSSGKSTLLNHLFHTNFKEMNAHVGRSQTTLGVWMAKCNGIEPCTIVMDLEGNDGRERGEDDTAFEKQLALFGLAVSDIVLINMWCNDIGREQAADKPLLRTVFQVMMQLFTPRKTTLMFVIRDKTDTPLESLESLLREDTQKIWDAIPKPEAHKQTPLSDFFNIQVEALAHYKFQKEEFEKEVAILRKKFFESIKPGGLAGDRRGAVPASAFSVSVQNMWKVIKENKDLDLPAHKVMVANIRCEEIANEKYSIFVANKEWLELKRRVEESNVFPGFGKNLSSLLAMSLSSYDEEATYFDESGKIAKRKQLQDRLIQLAQPTIKLMLKHIESGTLKKCKKELADALIGGQGFSVAARYCTRKFTTLFDKQCQDIVIEQEQLDLAKVKVTFSANLASHITEVRTANISKLTALYETKLEEALHRPMEVLFKGGSDDTWHEIRLLLHRKIESAVSEFSSALSSFDINEQATRDMVSHFKNYASGLVEGKAREEAAKVLYRVKERFIFMFNHTDDSRTRVWTDKEDIFELTINARSSCLSLLSVLTAIRLDNDIDTIRETLFLAWDPDTSQLEQNTLASSTWEKIPATKTLITPVECISVWNQFLMETEYSIDQAIASQEQYKRSELERIERIKQEEQDRKERERLEQELKELNDRERSVFGKPVTQGSHLERAIRALKDPNADNKRDKAIDYVSTQKANFGNGISTMCIFYNATGGTLSYDKEESYYGLARDLYLLEIKNGQWGAFLHSQRATHLTGSKAYVIYRVEGFCSSLLGWATPYWQIYSNHAFCDIYDDTNIDTSHNIYWKIDASARQYTVRKKGIQMTTTIESGTSPLFEAHFNLEEAVS